MSVDEVSWLKYHRYLTIVIDTDIKKVIWNAQGRKKEVLNRYYEALGPENCEKIESVAMDGARTYISSTEEYAKKAAHRLRQVPRDPETERRGGCDAPIRASKKHAENKGSI